VDLLMLWLLLACSGDELARCDLACEDEAKHCAGVSSDEDGPHWFGDVADQQKVQMCLEAKDECEAECP
jgi:tRNA G26 N,N-dimethylase Trm1